MLHEYLFLYRQSQEPDAVYCCFSITECNKDVQPPAVLRTDTDEEEPGVSVEANRW